MRDIMRSVVSVLLGGFFSLLITLSTAHASENIKAPFHAPKTSAEKALSQIINLSDHDNNLFEFILARPWYDGSKDKNYTSLFTKDFLDKWSRIERVLVLESCNGIYKEGETCGVDYDPITCGQDVLKTPLFYKTTENNGRIAKVQIAAAKNATDSALYILRHENGRWVLDESPCPIPDISQ